MSLCVGFWLCSARSRYLPSLPALRASHASCLRHGVYRVKEVNRHERSELLNWDDSLVLVGL
jgi:hypothetical protein